MINIRKILLILLTAVALPMALRGVDFTWNVDFNSVFDNREGDNDITDAKTYFFTKLAPEVGLKFSPNDRIAGGVVWFQPIGCEWEGHRVSPTVYYRHEDSRWRFSMGMFPRKQLTEEMPGYLWSDSLSYYQSNIRGALVQYTGERGYFDAYVDWRGMQTKSQREAFNIVFHGQMSPRRNWFNFGGYLQMNHYAMQKDAPEDQHIVDNFMVNPYLGVDLGKKTALDSLTVRAGLLMTVERNRAREDSSWDTPAGFYMEAVGEWRWLGVKNTLYVGKALMPSYNYPGAEFLDNDAPHATPEDLQANPVVYSPLGPGLYQGEPFYQKNFYDRLNVYGYILRRQHVSLVASLDFHISPSSFIFYQRLMLSVTLP
jgi:hypothetical protein